MRAIRVNAGAARSRERPGPGQERRSWLRWLPVPMAALAMVIGWLLIGGLEGQQAAAGAGQDSYRAGGLRLEVDHMLWTMSMGGEAQGFEMPGDMMPGTQKAGYSRLLVTVDLINTSSRAQGYSQRDFRAVTRDGKQSWKPYHLAGTENVYTKGGNDLPDSTMPISASLQPGFQTTLDLYFDVPTEQKDELSITWSRSGHEVDIPVDTNGHSMSDMPGM